MKWVRKKVVLHSLQVTTLFLFKSSNCEAVTEWLSECESSALIYIHDVLSLNLQVLNINEQLISEFMNINDGVWTEEESRHMTWMHCTAPVARLTHISVWMSKTEKPSIEPKAVRGKLHSKQILTNITKLRVILEFLGPF